MRNYRWTTLAIVALLGVLILPACGPKTVEHTVVMNEFTFDPTSITVPAGSNIKLHLDNQGALEHEYVIMVMGKEASAPFDAEDESNIYWEQELEAGQAADVEFTAPSEPGEYQVVCGTPGHLEQNMVATLVVTQ